MVGEGAGPAVPDPGRRQRKQIVPSFIQPARPTTRREYLLWLKEQALQLAELISYGDALADAGIITEDCQCRTSLMNATRILQGALLHNQVDMEYFPVLKERD